MTITPAPAEARPWPTLVPAFDERLGKTVLVEAAPTPAVQIPEIVVAAAAVNQAVSAAKPRRVINPTYNDIDDEFTQHRLYGFWVHERLQAENKLADNRDR